MDMLTSIWMFRDTLSIVSVPNMTRKVTTEERNILLDHPELVMFDPYSALKSHRCSLGKALIFPVVTGVLVFLWGYFCPEYIDAHPRIFAGIGCAALALASGFLPVLYFVLDDRTFKKAKAEHYAKQLQMLLPKDLECMIAYVQWVVVEKAEGGWILDGKEEMFGFCSYVNYFRIEPHTDLAVITDRESFWAFIRRDSKTECFYR